MPIIGISSNVILVIIGIGLLIFVHELGHFLVAKKVGVRVYAFSLGFGPAIIKKQIGETDYRISLIPLGSPRVSHDFWSMALRTEKSSIKNCA